MVNIISYFNYFLSFLFGGSPSSFQSTLLRLLYPSELITQIQSLVTSSLEAPNPLEFFILKFISVPSYLFSFIVWTWFAILTVNLLIIFPYKWIRSVIRRCRAS